MKEPSLKRADCVCAEIACLIVRRGLQLEAHETTGSCLQLSRNLEINSVHQWLVLFWVQTDPAGHSPEKAAFEHSGFCFQPQDV